MRKKNPRVDSEGKARGDGHVAEKQNRSRVGALIRKGEIASGGDIVRRMNALFDDVLEGKVEESRVNAACSCVSRVQKMIELAFRFNRKNIGIGPSMLQLQ